MALSTRAKLAGLGGALALGVLGATGYAYASDGVGTEASYVTTVDDGSTRYGAEQAPSDQPRSGDREDCPGKQGGGGDQPDRSGQPDQPDQSEQPGPAGDPADA